MAKCPPTSFFHIACRYRFIALQVALELRTARVKQRDRQQLHQDLCEDRDQLQQRWVAERSDMWRVSGPSKYLSQKVVHLFCL